MKGQRYDLSDNRGGCLGRSVITGPPKLPAYLDAESGWDLALEGGNDTHILR